MAKIRVGIINCDTHAAYFGPLMMRHDPMLLRESFERDDPRIKEHSWLQGSNHYYFYTFYNDPRLMTAPRAPGFEIVKIWDRQPFVAQAMRRLFYSKPVICDSFAHVSDDVDLVMICNCNYDGSDNRRFATPGLKKRVPTFVDKPFAHRLADVRAMVKLARQHRTPISSLSILQCVPAVSAFREQLDSLGPVQFGTVQGGGTSRGGMIHGVCTALAVFGSGVRQVRAVKTPDHVSLHLQFDKSGPPMGVMINCDVGPGWHGNFHCSAFGAGYPGAMHSRGVGDWEYPQGAAAILEHVKKMVKTGKAHGPVDQQIEGIAVCDAADKAIANNNGRPVRVASL